MKLIVVADDGEVIFEQENPQSIEADKMEAELLEAFFICTAYEESKQS